METSIKITPEQLKRAIVLHQMRLELEWTCSECNQDMRNVGYTDVDYGWNGEEAITHECDWCAGRLTHRRTDLAA